MVCISALIALTMFVGCDNAPVLPSFVVSGNITQTGDFLIGLDFIRRNLVSSLRHPGSPEDFFLNDDSIFSISVEKTLGHLSFRASLYTAQRYDADDEYLNGLKMEKNSTYPAFSLITSLRF